MGAVISLIKGADNVLLYLSIASLIIALVILFGLTYYITGIPFGTEIPIKSSQTIAEAIIVANNFIILNTTWAVCSITIIISLVLIAIFAVIKMGLGSGKNK